MHPRISNAGDATRRGTTRRNAEQTRKSSTANSAKQWDTCPKPVRNRKNGTPKPSNKHKARQMVNTETPDDTEDKANEHRVGRAIVMSNDHYKVYRMTGIQREDEEECEPTHQVYRTIEGGNRKTSITPPLLPGAYSISLPPKSRYTKTTNNLTNSGPI